MRPIRIGSASRIEIGYDGENGARAVVFDATKWMDEMPGCTAAITAQRADGQEYIAPDVTQDEAERTITWTLTSAETMEGEGRAQLLWMDGERIAKQAIFTTVCHESLKSDATQIGVPEPVWAQQSLAAAQEARKSAEAAKVSEIGAQNALEETKGVRDAAKQEIDTKKEGALAGIENAKAEAIVSIEAGKDELAPPVIPEATGTSIVATDSADRPLRGLTVYGKTTQDGTPSEDAPVDPMGTGTASPLRIVTAGRNLAALTPRTESNLGITSSYDAQTGVVTVTGTATGVAFVSYWLREPIPAGVSMVIGLGNGSSDNNIAIRVHSASENANTTIATLRSTNSVVKVTLTHAFEFLSIRVSAGATVNMKMQIGVTVGSDSAGYTWTHPDDPTSVQIIIPVSHFAVGGLLHGVPAIRGGNVTDGRQWIADTVEYDAQAGTAQLVQRVGSVTYFGGADENWVKGGSGSYFEIRRADKSSASHGLCTHYPGLAINAGEYKVGFTAATDKEYIRFRPTGYADMTVDQWRAKLEESPVTVLYALADPVTTPITGDELAALAQLRSRYPATTMYNDAGAQMAARYIADTKKYVDDADAEIAKAVIDVDGRVDAAMENIADVGKRTDAAKNKADENERNIGQLKDDIDSKPQFGDPYDGVDLTVKHSDEIVGYASPWAWIKARIAAGNFSQLHVGDYIPFTTTNGRTFQAQIAGINTYKGYGDTEIGNHIDFITRELWPDTFQMNPVNFNNGTSSDKKVPWLASNGYLFVNSLAGQVPNSTTKPLEMTDVDYTSGGIYFYLPDDLKAVIIEKRIYAQNRFSDSGVLTNDNSVAWVNAGKLWLPDEYEVMGARLMTTTGWFCGGYVQYPIFAHGMNRLKRVQGSNSRNHWWLSSAYGHNSTGFVAVYANGSVGNYHASDAARAPLCFRVS